MSLVLLDVATPKDSIIAKYIIKRLERLGIEYIVSARESTQTIPLLQMFGIEYFLTGRYGYTLEDKYRATLEQEIKIFELFEEKGYPDVIWSHGNVAGIRTAFHLGIPIIYSNDTPHNDPVVRLTVPLATRLISPEAVPKCKWVSRGIEEEKVIQYKGVEEVSWVKDHFNIDRHKIHKKYLGEDVDRLIVIRNIEYYASYSYGVKYNLKELVLKLAKEASIAIIPRYGDEINVFQGIQNVHVINKPIYAVELLASADVVISSGGTMAREACLLGIPTISYHFRDDIVKYLMGEGFPLRVITDFNKIFHETKDILRDPDKHKMDTYEKVFNLEDHIDKVIIEIQDVLD